MGPGYISVNFFKTTYLSYLSLNIKISKSDAQYNTTYKSYIKTLINWSWKWGSSEVIIYFIFRIFACLAGKLWSLSVWNLVCKVKSFPAIKFQPLWCYILYSFLISKNNMTKNVEKYLFLNFQTPSGCKLNCLL